MDPAVFILELKRLDLRKRQLGGLFRYTGKAGEIIIVINNIISVLRSLDIDLTADAAMVQSELQPLDGVFKAQRSAGAVGKDPRFLIPEIIISL